MSSGTVSPRLSASDDARQSAVDAAVNAAEYVHRMRALRQREAVSLVRNELRRRTPPVRPWGRSDRMLLLCAAVALVCAALALIVSSMGLFT